MTARAFHHGNLRAVLLDRAEAMLREVGTDGISLRELARQAGVSHGAPRSHFIDRQALLDTLAERGFDRLTDKLKSSMAAGDPFDATFHRVAHAYVEFAVQDAALMELMFAAKMADPPAHIQNAAERMFQTFDELIDLGHSDGVLSADAKYRLKLLFAVTMQGTATLTAARRITAAQGAALIDDATALILRAATEPTSRI
ncbi:TetR/AcrR family transcriptional regulator [Salinibacterium sp.]|uniref:TetR/AcrR family transcriptional regulator n=1 Tax=Salinibacterium sp. TaxID=1915057 RepID=UPI00286AA17B|nr:TetR/AcrR family transcriptional regulator [Salinibacterium sp.]